jgi:hypothetical protein
VIRLPQRVRVPHVICLSVALLGLAATLYKVHFPPGPVADEASYVMMTQSLWYDHDLRYERKDLQRAYHIWDQGPFGVILSSPDGGETIHYSKPYIYSLLALPFYLVFGVQGFVVFNMALFLAMLWTAWWWFRDERGFVGLFLGGFFFASAAFVYVFWMQPEVLNMAAVFFALAAWQAVRRKPRWGARELLWVAAAGGCLAVAFVSKEPTVLLGAPIGIDLLWQRRFKGVLVLAAGSLLALGLLVSVQHRLTGQWSPYRGVYRRSFENEYPLEAKTDLWSLYPGTTFGSWSGLRVDTDLRKLAHNAVYFVVGRHTGLVPYFPFALLALALYVAQRGDRSRHLLFLSIVAYCVLMLLIRPHNYQGGAGFLGNRYFASIYPAFLFLPSALVARKSLIFPYLAAGLWTLAVVAVPLQQVAPEFGLQVHTRTATFQALPLELTLIKDRRMPGYAVRSWGQGIWVVPRENFFAAENHPNGVWVRGASRSEVYVISPVPIDTLRFRVFSPLGDNVLTLQSGVDRVVVPFDTEAARNGRDVELEVKRVAHDLDFLGGGSPESFYRFDLTTTDGWMPARVDPESPDYRYLSTFLSFNGKPP